MKEKKRPLNEEIRASMVQVIDDDGVNLWEMSLRDALTKASELGLDLMEIGKNPGYTIVKMLDFWKYLYKQKKQDQKQKQKWKAPDLKTIKLTFKIGEHDVEIRKNQAIKFWQDWHPLKVVLTMKGRENQHAEIAKDKMNAFILSLSEVYKTDKPLMHTGNNLIVSLQTIK